MHRLARWKSGTGSWTADLETLRAAWRALLAMLVLLSSVFDPRERHVSVIESFIQSVSPLFLYAPSRRSNIFDLQGLESVRQEGFDIHLYIDALPQDQFGDDSARDWT